MSIDFSQHLADGADFPQPRIYAGPRLALKHLTLRSQSCIDIQGLQLTSSGRNAIEIAAECMRERHDDNRILVPAYHCPALIEPFLWHGYQVVFYPVRTDLSTDLNELQHIAKSTDATHGVVIRFFGFQQNAPETVATMKSLGLGVLEDCAHALFDFLDECSEEPPPRHYRICSLNKFLPTLEGGALHLRTSDCVELRSCSKMATLKGLVRLSRTNRPRQTAECATVNANKREAQQTNGAEDDTKRFRYFEPENAKSSALPQTRWLFEHSAYKHIAQKRRQVFNSIVHALKDSPMGTPLYEELGNSVPYVVPFLLNDARHFTTLRQAGLQILRWEELARSKCKVSESFRHHLIQVPCHQDLNNDDIDYIANTFAGSVHS